MKTYIYSALGTIAIGVLMLQPVDAQQDRDPWDREIQDTRAQERVERAADREREARREREEPWRDQSVQDDRQQRRERERMERERAERWQQDEYRPQRWREEERQDRWRERDDRRRFDSRRDRASERRTAQQPRRGRVTGEVVQAKRVDVRGSDRQHLVVLLKTDRGRRVPVDLGDVSRLGDEAPSRGDAIRIRGRLVRIGDRAVIIGEQLQSRGRRMVRIEQRDPRRERRDSREFSRRDRDRRRDSQDGRDRRGESRDASDRRGESQDRRGESRDASDRRGESQDRRGESEDGRGGLGIALAPADNGVRVLQVMPGSPAADAGIRPGDVITRIDETDVSSPAALIREVTEKDPGERVNLSVERQGDRRRLTAQLAEREEALNPRQDRSREQRRDSR